MPVSKGDRVTDDKLVGLLGLIEGPIRDKLFLVVKLVVSNLPEDPIDAFVSTSQSGSGVSYDGVWLFTPRYVSEIRNPLNTGRVQHEIARLSGLVDWVRLTARNYDFQMPQQESQLELEFTTSDGYGSTLAGVGLGCDRLMEVYRERFLKNIAAPEE